MWNGIIGPLEAYAPLLVNPDAELPFTITTESLKAIARQLH